jgi:hypothetical protein
LRRYGGLSPIESLLKITAKSLDNRWGFFYVYGMEQTTTMDTTQAQGLGFHLIMFTTNSGRYSCDKPNPSQLPKVANAVDVADDVKGWLPTLVPANRFRFFCDGILRKDFLKGTVTLDIDGEEVTCKKRDYTLGWIKEDCRLMVDLHADVVRKYGLA